MSATRTITQPLCAAITFLTVVRLPAAWCGEQQALARSLVWFAPVGLLIGLAVASGDWLVLQLCGSTVVASATTVIMLVAISGGLHLDGLGDSADAFMSSRGRERMLEIMKDSCCGPMAVFAIVAVMLLKFAALAALPPTVRYAVIVLTPLAGRCAIVINNVLLPYARSGGGLASITNDNSRPHQAITALALLLLAALSVGGGTALTLTAICAAFSCAFAAYCRRRIGGLTGDTLGAACELTELLPALVVLALLHQGG